MTARRRSRERRRLATFILRESPFKLSVGVLALDGHASFFSPRPRGRAAARIFARTDLWLAFHKKKNRRAGVKSDSTDYPKLVSLGRPRQRTATPASAPCLGHVAPRRLRVFGVPPLHAQTRSRPRVPRAQGAERAAGGRTRARRFAGTSTHPSSSSRRLAATHGESSSGDSRDGPSHRALSPAPKRCARRLAVSAGPQGARRLSRRRAPPRGGRGNRGEARVGRLLGRPAPPFPNRAPALREPLRNGRAEAVRAAAHAGRVGRGYARRDVRSPLVLGTGAARTSASADAPPRPAKSPAAFFQTKTRASPVVFFPPRTTTTTERSSPRCRRRDAACLPGRCGAFRLCRTGLGTRTNEKTSRTRRLFAARRA